jgi:hypothetical protein
VVSVAAVLASLWLVSLHAALLWNRVVTATISDPAVLFRWIASALLIAGALAGRRYAWRHFSRRKSAIVFWLLVLLLHATIPAEERVLATADLVPLIAQTGVLTIAIVFAVAALQAGTSLVQQTSASHQIGYPHRRLLVSPAGPRSPPLL